MYTCITGNNLQGFLIMLSAGGQLVSTARQNFHRQAKRYELFSSLQEKRSCKPDFQTRQAKPSSQLGHLCSALPSMKTPDNETEDKRIIALIEVFKYSQILERLLNSSQLFLENV